MPPARASTVSATTLLSSASAPSLVWTASDGASIRTQSTHDNGAAAPDMTAIHDPDMAGVVPGVGSKDRTWLESPCAMQSPPTTSGAANTGATASSGAVATSPHMPIATLKKYQCPMCFLDRNLVEFGRKSDFKKHLNNFHGTDTVWICRTKSCHLSFATERSYSTHAKEAHRMEALPSSAARTELCPQLVFACGFGSCKDRVFESPSRDDAPASRDKYFEHIAKHFEDDFDVNDWEYRVQIQNLMRQHRVKPIWKTCIWPKERRQQLSWKPRSSGDLRRMLEARHLGEDISQLVRLAYILGTAPFTSSRTPPPSEIDLHFQLPYRSQCLIETDGPPSAKTNGSSGSEDGSTTPSVKSRPQSMFRLPSRKGRNSRSSRPETPASSISVPPPPPPSQSAVAVSGPPADTPMGGAEQTSGPHPGTPIPIPHETMLPADAPKFAPEPPPQLPKQLNNNINTPSTGTPMGTPIHGTPIHGTPVSDSPAMYGIPLAPEDHQQHGFSMFGPPPTSVPNGMMISPYEAPMEHQHPHHHQDAASDYDEAMYGCTPTNNNTNGHVPSNAGRPATPVPHKRPASWSRVSAMEEMHPKKKTSTPAPNGAAYGMDSPTMPMEQQQQQQHSSHNPHAHPHASHASHHQSMTAMPVMDQIPNAYGEMIPPHVVHHHPQQSPFHHQQPQHQQPAPPTSMPEQEWVMAMRMSGHEPQGGYAHPQQQQQHHAHHPQYHQEAVGMEPMTTFFFDDSERM